MKEEFKSKKSGLITLLLSAIIVLSSCSLSPPTTSSESTDASDESVPSALIASTETLEISGQIVQTGKKDNSKWTMIEAGAGGFFVDVGVGPTGIAIAAADLSGIYISYDQGQTWHNRGQAEGIVFHTHLSAIAFDPDDENLIYVGSENTLYKSYDKGQTFHPILSKDWNPINRTGTLEVVKDASKFREYKDPTTRGSGKLLWLAIAFAPSNPNIGYASAHLNYNSLDSVIFKTTDRGETWKPVKAFKNSAPGESVQFNEDKRIQKFIVDHTNPDTVYFLTQTDTYSRTSGPGNLGPQNAIYKSTDGGATWHILNGGNDHTVTYTANADIASYDENGQHRIDPEKRVPIVLPKGTQITEPVLTRNVLDFALDPVNPNILYATKGHRHERGKIPGEGTYKSVDSGGTWTKVDTKFGVLTVKAVDNDASKTIVRRIDIGGWESPSSPLQARNYPQLWESQDAGATWTLKADKMKFGFGAIDPQFYSQSLAYAKTIDYNPNHPDLIFWGEAQWVYMSDDGGASFRSAGSKVIEKDGQKWYTTTGVSNVVSFTLKVSEADPNIILQGNGDIGLWRSLDNGQSWQHSNQEGFTSGWLRYGGQVQTIALDPERPNVAWVGLGGYYVDQLMAKSTEYGEIGTWKNVHNGLPKEKRTSAYEEGAALRGLSVDRTSPKEMRTLFVSADERIYKSVDDGENWMEVFDMTDGKPFNFNQLKGGSVIIDRNASTAVDPKDGDYVYAGGPQGLFRSTKGGEKGTWEKFGPGTWANIQKIIVSPQNSDHIYIAVYGEGLYFTPDRGTTWRQILKDPYLRGFAVHPQDERVIIAGSTSVYMSGGYVVSKGALLSVDGGQTWTEANEGLSWKIVRDVEFNVKNPNQVFIVTPGTSHHVREFDFEAYGLTVKK